MINGTTANSTSQSTRSSLTYVNNIVTGCTSRGEYVTSIDARYIDDSVMSALIGLGYKVTKSTSDMGTFVTYKIGWN
jgi:hypothetical protein